MNCDMWAGQWRQLRGKIRKEWGKLTDDDFDKIQGDYDMLLGRLQELYGKSRDEIEKDLEYRFSKGQEPARKVS